MRAFQRISNSISKRIRRIFFRYKAPILPFRHLSSENSRFVQVSIDSEENSRPSSDLYEIWRNIPGGHKWWHYFGAYESVMAGMRTRPIRMLEIGVYKGGSLAMWRNYLHPESIIVGLDIDSDCEKFNNPANNIHVLIGDQSNKKFLASVVQKFGPFDVIIDDGSHVCSHMIASFDFLFPNGLKDGGLYLAEDTHTNFWPEFRDQRYSFIDLCKDLVDLSHAHYHTVRGIVPFTLGHQERLQTIDMPRIGAMIEEIIFLDSIVMMKKNLKRMLPTSEHI